MKKQPEDRLAQLLAILEARTKLLAFFFGLCFVAILLVLAICFPEPTPFQYTVFRITLALAAAGVAGVIPGMIRLKVQPGTALLIHAGGALAVFVIVYLIAPVALRSEQPAREKLNNIKHDVIDEDTNRMIAITNNAGGKIQVTYGLTKDQLEVVLEKQLKKIEKNQSDFNLVQHVLIEQQRMVLKKKLSAIPKRYDDELKRRISFDEAIYFQSIELTLATENSDKEKQLTAGNSILSWKYILSEKETFLRQQLSQADDQEVIELLNKRIVEITGKLSQELHLSKKTQDFDKLIKLLNQYETAMLTLAPRFRETLEIEEVRVDQVLSALPQESGLIEYRLFQPIDFKTGKLKEYHLAALLFLANPKNKQRFFFRNLGPFAEIEEHLKDKTAETYKRLLGFFDKQIKNLKQLYIAPDGPLSLLSFASFRLPDGRFLAERQQINRLQTGRDLLENSKDFPRGKGLVAIGGVKYGPMPAGEKEASAYQQRVVQMLRVGFDYLPESRKEAQTIGQIFTNNTGEKPTVLIGDDASEYNLKHLKQPPRILHLSTHGFYLGDNKKENGLTEQLREEAPLLLSGVALAGANNGLQGKLDKHGDDGLLYSLEVLGLNLHGTELVSLSACDTGKGVVDYSEGVYGLVRAFRTAGAANVLMTLTPVGDKSSRDFMTTFYDNWLYPGDPDKNWFDGAKKSTRTPAKALHQTRLDFIHDNRPVQDWAPFVLVGK